MKILSFFGLLGAFALFALTWIISDQYCYNWGCDCEFEIAQHQLYIIASLIFSVFFLTYCIIFFFRISETQRIQQQDTEESLLDNNLISKSYNMYQLPTVRLFSQLGLVFSLGILIFAFTFLDIQCVPVATCPSMAQCDRDFSYDDEIYTIGYGVWGVYFLMLTLVGLMKSYPIKN